MDNVVVFIYIISISIFRFIYYFDCFWKLTVLLFRPTVRSTMPDITALGVAMVAGHAEGIDVWNLEGEEVEIVPTDTFLPTTTPEGKF